MMLYKLIDEVELANFDVNEFVERLTWRAMDGVSDPARGGAARAQFNPQIIHDAFTAAIRQLVDLDRKQQEECHKLEQQLQCQDALFVQSVKQLIDKNKEEFETVQRLDEKISLVSTKVAHLGDQLHSVNVPRQRGLRALALMRHLDYFIDPHTQSDDSSVFDDESKFFEAADAIQVLYQISREMTSSKFEAARRRIADKYGEIERQLLARFVRAHRADDRHQMKTLAAVLSQFSGYIQCVDTFIEHCLQGVFISADLFSDIIPACERTEPLVHFVFQNATHVMCRFVLNICHGKLQQHVQQELADRSSNTADYWDRVASLYSRALTLIDQLAKYDLGHTAVATAAAGSGAGGAGGSGGAAAAAGGGGRVGFLRQLVDPLFQPYLVDYVGCETRQLSASCAQQLAEYYQQCGHQRRQLHGGLGELRREAAAALGTKTTLNIAHTDNYGGQTFLSEELTINLLQESQRAFKRCQILTTAGEQASTALQIYNIISNTVLVEHVEYAIELALQAVPVNEPRVEPQLYFYDVVRQTNGLVHLMDKHYADWLLPLVSGSSCESEPDQCRQTLLAAIEQKLAAGLERTVAAAGAWCRVLLQTEQRATDFRPDTDSAVMPVTTQACKKVVRYVTGQVARVRDSCDGDNLALVLTEFGERFHRVLVDHLLQFQYNTAGAMTVICDVNEYRKCAGQFDSALLQTLFDTLHSLCNLLLVLPQNLHDVIAQSDMDSSVIMSFVQLRVDFKTARIATLIQNSHK